MKQVMRKNSNDTLPILVLFLALACAPATQERNDKLALERSEPVSLDEITTSLSSAYHDQGKIHQASPSKLKACIQLVNRLSSPLRLLLPYLGAHPKGDNLPFHLSDLTPSHCAGPSYAKTIQLANAASSRKPQRIGLILPLGTEHRELAMAVLDGAKAAAQRLGLAFAEHFVVKDSAGTGRGALTALAELTFYDEASLIIGGLGREEAEAIIPFATGLVSPMLILNKDTSLIKDQTYAFQVYPNQRDLAAALAWASAKMNYRNIAILRPQGGKADYLCSQFSQFLTQRGLTVKEDLSYLAGDYESMNHTVQTIANTNIEKRRSEYLQLVKKAQEAAHKEGVPFNQRHVILPAKLQVDAVFIPDNYRNIHFFIKLFKYHGIDKLALIGNHEWRSKDLLEPWDGFLQGSIFADFIGSYQQIPPSLVVKTASSEFFLPTKEVVHVDFRLLGFRSAAIALQTVSNRFLKRKYLVRQLMKTQESEDFFKFPSTFYPDRSVHWPTYVFTIGEEKLQLLGRYEGESNHVKAPNSSSPRAALSAPALPVP